MAYLIDRPSPKGFWERFYLPAVLQGMMITARHFLRNLIRMRSRITIEYPEQKRPLPPGYRAEHRLMRRDNGDIRCSACMLCATICPANCIEIEAEEVDDPRVEKRAKSFVIDELRCAFCGLCVEVCPCDAIRMDTGLYENASFDRSVLVYDKDRLLANTPEGASSLSSALY